jgi:prepilin-type N-terminal cleavage/methylation domain-containing protein/prepilin-type processing-associated H-X9-DG protein
MKARHLKSSKPSGFTLIELLVVISIIAMLASLSLPAIQTAIEKGKSAKCMGNLRGIGSAVNQYIADPVNGHQYPPIYSASGGSAEVSAGTAPPEALSPLACLEAYGVTMPMLTCPSDHAPSTNYGSYMWSPVLQGEQPESVHIYARGGVFTIDKLSRLTVCTDNGTPHLGKFNILRADGHVESRP